jgi:bacterioferritin-associated ferredoxin
MIKKEYQKSYEMMSNKNKNNLICHCNNVSYQAVDKILKSNPSINFETFQKESGAGTSCTACLPKLENEFINKSNLNNFPILVKKSYDRLGLKKKLYNFFDSILPKVSFEIKNYFPIIYNHNIKIKIWISNYANLYQDDNKIVNHKLKFTLYNSIGQIVWKKNYFLKKNDNLIIDIPNELINQSSSDQLSSGWICLGKKSETPGFKGTTRPQIQILTDKSSCAVHGQNIHVRNGGSHSYVYNPKYERQFLSFFNIGKNKINLYLSYLNKDDKFVYLINFNLEPLNSKIIEIDLANANFNEFDPVIIRWEGKGLYKTHVFISDKNLERLSIDHL